MTMLFVCVCVCVCLCRQTKKYDGTSTNTAAAAALVRRLSLDPVELIIIVELWHCLLWWLWMECSWGAGIVRPNKQTNKQTNKKRDPSFI